MFMLGQYILISLVTVETCFYDINLDGHVLIRSFSAVE